MRISQVIKGVAVITLSVSIGWAGGYLAAHDWNIGRALNQAEVIDSDAQTVLPGQERGVNLEEARGIAEQHLRERGITAEFSSDVDSDFDADNDGARRSHWELEYRAGNRTYEIYVDAQNGDILKFESDHEDED